MIYWDVYFQLNKVMPAVITEMDPTLNRLIVIHTTWLVSQLKYEYTCNNCTVEDTKRPSKLMNVSKQIATECIQVFTVKMLKWLLSEFLCHICSHCGYISIICVNVGQVYQSHKSSDISPDK